MDKMKTKSLPQEQASDWSKISEREVVRLAIESPSNFEPAIVQLWDRYKKRLYLYIKYKLNVNKGFESDRERYIVEDILQNVFCDVMENLREYKPQFEVSTWIYNISNKHIVRYIREIQKYQGRTVGIDEDSYETMGIAADVLRPDAVTELKEFEQIVVLFVKSLKKADDQEVFLLYLQNLHNKNISNALGKTNDAIRARLNRVIKKFKKFMNRDYPEYMNTSILSHIKNLSFGNHEESLEN